MLTHIFRGVNSLLASEHFVFKSTDACDAGQYNLLLAWTRMDSCEASSHLSLGDHITSICVLNDMFVGSVFSGLEGNTSVSS